MIKSAGWVVSVFAFLLAVIPAPSMAARDPGIDPPTPDLPGYSATIIKEAVQVTIPPGKILIVSALVPYVDEYGTLFDLHVNFETKAFVLKQNGADVGSGVMDPKHSNALPDSLIQLRTPSSSRTIDDKHWLVVAGIVVGIVGIAVAIYYAERAEDLAQAESLRDLGRCYGEASRQTATAGAQAAAACSMQTFTDERGRICQMRASFTTASPEQCLGENYSGCRAECH